MENKYYVPDISEICIGFEYESQDPLEDDHWFKHVISTHYQLIHAAEEFVTDKPTSLRVKYLDLSDIKELGWEYKWNEHGTLSFQIGNWVLSFTNDSIVQINYGAVMFRSHKPYAVKNKSSLKNLMSMLDIPIKQ